MSGFGKNGTLVGTEIYVGGVHSLNNVYVEDELDVGGDATVEGDFIVKGNAYTINENGEKVKMGAGGDVSLNGVEENYTKFITTVVGTAPNTKSIIPDKITEGDVAMDEDGDNYKNNINYTGDGTTAKGTIFTHQLRSAGAVVSDTGFVTQGTDASGNIIQSFMLPNVTSTDAIHCKRIYPKDKVNDGDVTDVIEVKAKKFKLENGVAANLEATAGFTSPISNEIGGIVNINPANYMVVKPTDTKNVKTVTVNESTDYPALVVHGDILCNSVNGQVNTNTSSLSTLTLSEMKAKVYTDPNTKKQVDTISIKSDLNGYPPILIEESDKYNFIDDTTGNIANFSQVENFEITDIENFTYGGTTYSVALYDWQDLVNFCGTYVHYSTNTNYDSNMFFQLFNYFHYKLKDKDTCTEYKVSTIQNKIWEGENDKYNYKNEEMIKYLLPSGSSSVDENYNYSLYFFLKFFKEYALRSIWDPRLMEVKKDTTQLNNSSAASGEIEFRIAMDPYVTVSNIAAFHEDNYFYAKVDLNSRQTMFGYYCKTDTGNVESSTGNKIYGTATGFYGDASTDNTESLIYFLFLHFYNYVVCDLTSTSGTTSLGQYYSYRGTTNIKSGENLMKANEFERLMDWIEDKRSADREVWDGLRKVIYHYDVISFSGTFVEDTLLPNGVRFSTRSTAPTAVTVKKRIVDSKYRLEWKKDSTLYYITPGTLYLDNMTITDLYGEIEFHDNTVMKSISGVNGEPVEVDSMDVKNMKIDGVSFTPGANHVKSYLGTKLYTYDLLFGAIVGGSNDPADSAKVTINGTGYACAKVRVDINYCGSIAFIGIRPIIIEGATINSYLPTDSALMGGGHFKIAASDLFEINPYNFSIMNPSYYTTPPSGKSGVAYYGDAPIYGCKPTTYEGSIKSAVRSYKFDIRNKYIVGEGEYRVYACNASSTSYSKNLLDVNNSVVSRYGKVIYYTVATHPNYFAIGFIELGSNTLLENYTETHLIVDGCRFCAVEKNASENTTYPEYYNSSNSTV